MINHNLLTDRLAMQIADKYIRYYCVKQVREALKDHFCQRIKEELESKRQPNQALFDILFKALDSHKKRFSAMLVVVWSEQRKIIIANLKKLKKAQLTISNIDSVLYPGKPFEKRIAEQADKLFRPIMQERGDSELEEVKRRKAVKQAERFEFNEQVEDWLNTYVFKLSENLERVNTEALRAELIEGMKEGEGIPQLIGRVNTTYEGWYKYRSEMIARTEVLRASNRAAIEAYRQSGVVKKKQWITYIDRRTCPWCEQMDGKIVSIESSYFEQGDSFTIDVEGKDRTMRLDYESVESPPLHPDCRCSICAYFD